MNILVIGHSVVDKIVDEEKVLVKPGGIFYTIIALLSQVEKQDSVYLCSEIDEANEKLFKNIYSKVETKYLSYAQSIPEVELTLRTGEERNEKYSEILNNLTLPLSGLNKFDGILINMISGFDISLDQLRSLRKIYNGLIYFDVHTLSRGVDENFNRSFTKIPDFHSWAECIDILQANETELRMLSKKEEEREIIEELFSYGVRQIIVTKAERGATVISRVQETLEVIHQDAIKTNSINKIGCGDVLGAVYFYNYIKNKNVNLALERANLFAGIITTYSDISDFISLKNDALKWNCKK